MGHVREALRLQQALDLNRPGHTNPREIVSAEVDEHHVLGAILLGGQEPRGVTVARVRRSRDRVQARAAVLGLDERLGRRADERHAVELEQEEVRRGVDAAKGSVELERGRGRRPLGALGEDDLERIARADMAFRTLDCALVLEAPRRAPRTRSAPVSPSAGRKRPELTRELRRDLGLVAAEHVCEARDVVEADEHVGDDELALRKVATGVRQPDGRLEPRRVVVGEIADDGLAAGLRLVDADDPRAVADERVPPEPPVLDGLEQERGAALVRAQPEVRTEGGDEIGCYDGDRVHLSDKQKRPPKWEVFERNGSLPTSDQAMLPPRSWRRYQAQPLRRTRDIAFRVGRDPAPVKRFPLRAPRWRLRASSGRRRRRRTPAGPRSRPGRGLPGSSR